MDRALTRRRWLVGAGALLLTMGCSTKSPKVLAPEDHGDTSSRFPGKVAMRLINDRPTARRPRGVTSGAT